MSSAPTRSAPSSPGKTLSARRADHLPGLSRHPLLLHLHPHLRRIRSHFFGDHYARSWFDPWDSRWYTGFTLTSYPPGSQQTIALLSKLVGLGYAFVIAQTFALLMCTVGIYRFSKIWVSEEAAGYAALLFVFSSSITETVHVFGQLPTTFSLGFLLNALPFVYRWLDKGSWKMLLAAWAMNAATTAGHHVTTLFGAVFLSPQSLGWR